MAAEKTDLRVVRTRNAIKQAFVELVGEGGLDKMSVKAITERAGINRKTFYLHYETIEALFEDVLNGVMDDFFENYETTPDKPEDIDGHAQRFFLFMAGQPEYVEKLVCTPSYYQFGEKVYFEQMSRYRSVGNPFGWMSDGQKRLVARFIRSTALEFYRSWVAEGKRVPPEEAAQLLSDLTCHGVEPLLRS
jgi:AcrR family transcriptional regulator